MKQAQPVITVKDLYKIYRVGETRVRALNGVDFHFTLLYNISIESGTVFPYIILNISLHLLFS